MTLSVTRLLCKDLSQILSVCSRNIPNAVGLLSSAHYHQLKSLPNVHKLKPLENNFKFLPLHNYLSVRYFTPHHVDRPRPETCKKNLRYEVYYPKDGVYTIAKLPMRKLGGRDPETGRLIFGCIGGGSKRKYRWVQDHRIPLDHESDTLVEKVLQLQYDPNRTARIALVGQSTKLRYIIATTSMKPGNLITSTRVLPDVPIRPKEGDAHPVGALPPGTTICCIERMPKAGISMMINAGTHATVVRKLKDKMLVRLPNKNDMLLELRCIVVVGQVSNPDHGEKHIGSGWRLRWLGRRPRSGLWQRKTGRFGRKVRAKPPPPLQFKEEKPKSRILYLTAPGEGPARKIIPSTLRVS